MGQIVDSIRNVASMISDISTTTLSQTRDINDINTAVAPGPDDAANSALVEGLPPRPRPAPPANEPTHLISQFVFAPTARGAAGAGPRPHASTASADEELRR